MNFRLNIKELSESERLYNLTCPIVGLTGGISTGKSTVSHLLKEKGFSIICADKLVKDVYKSIVTIQYISEKFPQVLETADEVNFKKLRKLFFSNTKVKSEIELLIYAQLPDAFLSAYAQLNSPSLVIYDVPLLFEKDLAQLVDLKVVVYCDENQQIERLIKRDSIDKALAKKIISQQMNIEEKKKLADIVIDNQEESGPKLAQFLDCFQT